MRSDPVRDMIVDGVIRVETIGTLRVFAGGITHLVIFHGFIKENLVGVVVVAQRFERHVRNNISVVNHTNPIRNVLAEVVGIIDITHSRATKRMQFDGPAEYQL